MRFAASAKKPRRLSNRSTRQAGKRGLPMAVKSSSPGTGRKKISSSQLAAAAGVRRNGTTASIVSRMPHSTI